MKHIPVFTLLLLCGFCTSCNGQVKNDLPKEKAVGSKILLDDQSKLQKTQSKNPGDNVHCSLQDNAGNLWFGTTADGIYRYDGKLFTHYTVTHGLNSNTVWCMREDKSGKIWIGTSDGVCMYDGKKFTKIQIASLTDLLPGKYDVWSMMQDKSGKLWFATGRGVYVYDGKSFASFAVSEGAPDCPFKTEYILQDNVGAFWFGGRCNAGVMRYDGKSLTHLKPNGDNWVWPVLQDRNGNIWFSNWFGAYRYDGKSFTGFSIKDGLADKVITRIMEDKNGNLWFCGGGGIARYDGKTFTPITTKDGLDNRGIWTMLEDKTGNLWIGTTETGLYRYDGKTFAKFSE